MQFISHGNTTQNFMRSKERWETSRYTHSMSARIQMSEIIHMQTKTNTNTYSQTKCLAFLHSLARYCTTGWLLQNEHQ